MLAPRCNEYIPADPLMFGIYPLEVVPKYVAVVPITVNPLVVLGKLNVQLSVSFFVQQRSLYLTESSKAHVGFRLITIIMCRS